MGVDTGLEFGGAEAVGGEPAGAWAGRGSERVAGPTGPRAWWGRKPCGDTSLVGTGAWRPFSVRARAGAEAMTRVRGAGPLCCRAVLGAWEGCQVEE